MKNRIIKVIIFIVLLFVLLFLYGAWNSYYYGDRLKAMCETAKGKTIAELETLIDDYGFNSRIIKYKDPDKENIWSVGLRPSLIAACNIEHNENTVISTSFFWD